MAAARRPTVPKRPNSRLRRKRGKPVFLPGGKVATAFPPFFVRQAAEDSPQNPGNDAIRGMDQGMKRRLTTVLYAAADRPDANGDSDDGVSLARLNGYRALLARQFERRDGRQVNRWGHAVVAEFPSVVEAVRCAIDVQRAVASKNAALDRDERLWFRIGINLGDVVLDTGDVYGDGVNVAARLEALAEPGGIVVSGTVHELTRKQVDAKFDFIGDKTIKNIDEPVASYAVRIERSDGQEAADAQTASRLQHIAVRAEELWAWLKAQPKSVRYAAGLIGLFIVLNALFGGIASPWFVAPSIPLALYIYLRARRPTGAETARSWPDETALPASESDRCRWQKRWSVGDRTGADAGQDSAAIGHGNDDDDLVRPRPVRHRHGHRVE